MALRMDDENEHAITDGYPRELFIDDIDDSLFICTICGDIACNAYSSTADNACTHVFCHKCINNYIAFKPNSSTISCPNCKRLYKATAYKFDKMANHIIRKSKIKCPYHEKGCTSAFMIGTDEHGLKHHLSQCTANKIICTLCNVYISIDHIDRHENDECEQRIVACRTCKEEYTASALKEHQQNRFKCDNMIECPYACIHNPKAKHRNILRILKKDLEEHTHNTCLHRYRECDICNNTILRHMYDNHCRDSNELHIRALKQQNNILSQKYESLHQTHEETSILCKQLQKQIDFLHKGYTGVTLMLHAAVIPCICVPLSIYMQFTCIWPF